MTSFLIIICMCNQHKRKTIDLVVPKNINKIRISFSAETLNNFSIINRISNICILGAELISSMQGPFSNSSESFADTKVIRIN